jgi:hypothetical protein
MCHPSRPRKQIDRITVIERERRTKLEVRPRALPAFTYLFPKSFTVVCPSPSEHFSPRTKEIKFSASHYFQRSGVFMFLLSPYHPKGIECAELIDLFGPNATSAAQPSPAMKRRRPTLRFRSRVRFSACRPAWMLRVVFPSGHPRELVRRGWRRYGRRTIDFVS